MRFLKMSDVMQKVGLSRPMIYRCIKMRGFPPPMKIGAASVWLESAVDAWMLELLESQNG